jgi:toxin ParE1/3/4
MFEIKKRPQVIRDLIDLATYIAEDNLDVSDRFLTAAEATFKQLAKTPAIGKECQFIHPNLAQIRLLIKKTLTTKEQNKLKKNIMNL